MPPRSRTSLLTALGVTALLVGASFALGPVVTSEGGAAAERAAPVDLTGAIGFVDMEALKDGYPGTVAREGELRELVNGFKDRMAALQKEVTDAEVEDFRRKLRSHPDGFVAQPLIDLSTCPTWSRSRC